MLLAGYMLLRAGANLFETAIWHGDAGMELQDMRAFVTEGDWLQLGPASSTGGFRVPPFFTHLMLPAAWLTNWTVYGPIIWSAILGALTIPLLYAAVRTLSGSRVAGLTASYVYAMSALLTPMFRTLWSIFPAWFFLALWLFAGVCTTKNPRRDAAFLAIATATAASFHPFLFYLFPLGVGWFLLRLRRQVDKRHLASIFFGILAAIHLPVILFELRTGFANLRGFLSDYGTVQQSLTTSVSPLTRLGDLLVYSGKYLLPPSAPDWIIATLPWLWGLIYLGFIGYLIARLRDPKGRQRALFILLTFGLGLLQLLLYRGPFELRYWIPLWLLPPAAIGVTTYQLRRWLSRWPAYRPLFLTVAGLLLALHLGWNHFYSWQTYVARSGVGRPYATNYYGDIRYLTNWIAAKQQGESFNFFNNIDPFSQTDFTYLFERRNMPFSPDADQLFVLDNQAENREDTPYGHCLDETKLVLSYFEFRLYNLRAASCPRR